MNTDRVNQALAYMVDWPTEELAAVGAFALGTILRRNDDGLLREICGTFYGEEFCAVCCLGEKAAALRQAAVLAVNQYTLAERLKPFFTQGDTQ